MFGYTARHLKITYFQEPSADACDQRKIHWEEEGWYIDLDVEPVCVFPANPPRCRDKIEIKHVGSTTKVFPLIKTLIQYSCKMFRMRTSQPGSLTSANLMAGSTPASPANLAGRDSG